MKRYYSHYTFIYPDIFIKNHIVELNGEYQITHIFPFDKEIERTEFYSGLLIFLPDNIDKDLDIQSIMNKDLFHKEPLIQLSPEKRYKIIHKEDFIL